MRGYDSYYDPPDEPEDWDTEPLREDFESEDEYLAYLESWREDVQNRENDRAKEAEAEQRWQDDAVAKWLAAGCKCSECCNFMHWTDFMYTTLCTGCEALMLEQSYELVWEGDPEEWATDYT